MVEREEDANLCKSQLPGRNVTMCASLLVVWGSRWGVQRGGGGWGGGYIIIKITI